MATLRSLSNDKSLSLSSNHTVGRAPSNQLRIEAPSVSAHHAHLWWNGEQWSVRDLNSTNGVLINGESLRKTQETTFTSGDKISFGSLEHTWLCQDDAPPVPLITHAQTNELSLLKPEEVLALPSAERPLFTIYYHDQVWLLENEGQTRPLIDQEELTIEGDHWSVSLPQQLHATAPAQSQSQLNLPFVTFRFGVSSDEEWVDLEIRREDQKVNLTARSCFYPLLTLARKRLGDREAGLPREEEGWLESAQLAQMLHVPPTQLNVDIYRIRESLARAEIGSPALVIERKIRPSRLRLNIESIEIAPQS